MAYFEYQRCEYNRMRQDHPEYFEPWGGHFALVDKAKGNILFQTIVAGSTGNQYHVKILKEGGECKTVCHCTGYRTHHHCYHQSIAERRYKESNNELGGSQLLAG